jgi:uncharacterized protein
VVKGGAEHSPVTGAAGPVVDDVLIHRMTPAVDPDCAFFWASGADGLLRIQRCRDCGYFVHPPVGFCPRCESTRCEPQVVSGTGRVHTLTVNHQPWVSGQRSYIIAMVELDEQQGLRLTTNLVNCAPDIACVGMRVTVAFVHRHDVWYPVFMPTDAV